MRRKVKPILKALLKTIYPPRCLSCGDETEGTARFCVACWPDAHFIAGLVCDSCGVPLSGQEGEAYAFCETCHSFPPAWRRGRAVALYDGPVRRMVLSLKHGDRLDVALPAGDWMAKAAEELICPDTIVTAVPLHWRRLFSRRFNQAVVLGQRLAKAHKLPFVPDALRRIRPTVMQKDMTREQRFTNQRDVIRINPRQTERLAGRPVLIVDDVMTTGATLSACAEACLANKSSIVNVIVLARVARAE